MLRASTSTLTAGRMFMANRTLRWISTTSATHFSLFNWFSPKSSSHNSTTPSNPTSDIPPNSSPSSSTSTSVSLPDHVDSSTKTQIQTQQEQQQDAKKHPNTQAKLLARDQELLTKLLDREGGSAGISIINGKYEEGLGPESKKNMFRLI